jgi:spermidine synthase
VPKKWVPVDRATIPGTDKVLELRRAGQHWHVLADGKALMSTSMHTSEEVLAQLVCARLARRSAPRVLIGGLGLGFTLAAALRGLPAAAEVVVAELVPELVAWNRGEAGAPSGHPLADPRVRVFEGDVGDAMDDGPWDAILLDVDNGPDGLTRPENDALYDYGGLARARAALRQNGVLAVWSAEDSREFTERLGSVGFDVTVEKPLAAGRSGTRHVVWLATRR